MAEFIKRDALKDFYCKSCPVGDKDKCMGEGCKVYQARKLIANIPSVIEVEPVRHGRWENPTESKPRMFERTGHTFTERQCSECKLWNISVTGSIMCKYCPNCGARMDATDTNNGTRTTVKEMLTMAEMAFKVSLEEFGKRAAEYALDGITYNDLTIRQWADKIASGEFQPVRHGRWADNGEDKWICSACKGYVWRWSGKQNFCPNCGAKMENGR